MVALRAEYFVSKADTFPDNGDDVLETLVGRLAMAVERVQYFVSRADTFPDKGAGEEVFMLEVRVDRLAVVE